MGIKPRQVRHTAKQAGCTIEGDDTAYRVEAAAGKVWEATGLHEHVYPHHSVPDWRAKAYEEMAYDLQSGFRDCEDPDCEWCDV